MWFEGAVIANDSGGAVAQLFVTKYPLRVRTLLLWDRARS
jgi:pimeloyl-ACP methyl ester carboxylesterase